jgi:predicted MPP superfamily phosphohydrolase
MARLLALTALGHAVFAAGAAFALQRAGAPHPWVLAGVLAAAGVAAFVPRGNAILRGERRSRLALALVDLPYFVHWTGGLLALPLAVLLALAAAVTGASFGAAMAAAYVAGCALAAWGALVRRRWVVTERVSIAIDGLDPRLDGYRIAHLSDLHIGPYTPRAWGLRWARRANALGCDLVVVTGDLVTSGAAFHADVADVIGALRAKDGVLVVMGNHDYSSQADALVAMLEARGVRVLRNAGSRTHAQGRLFVAGLDDRWSRRADLDRALSARPDGVPTILLAHDPADFPAAAARGVDLVLSGHTHGGQIALPLAPRRFNAGRLHRRHTLGVYRRGRSALVVHPGLGTSGPPVRVGVAPAVVEITLCPSAPSPPTCPSG